MSNETENRKNKQPDYHLQLVQEGRNGKEQITDVGALWKGKNGYLTGQSIAGRLICQPHAAREDLQRMRQDKSQHESPAQQSQEVSLEQ